MSASLITPATVIAAILPIVGIVLSGWSFSFSEKGATPDTFPDISPDYEFDEEILDLGERRRARRIARLLFILGALCLAASVPMGIVDNHALALTTLPAISCYLLLLLGAVYGVREVYALWQDLRQDAFSSFYDGKKFSQFYKNRSAIEVLFFTMNPLPIWSLFSRYWRTSLTIPNANQVLAADQAESKDTQIEP